MLVLYYNRNQEQALKVVNIRTSYSQNNNSPVRMKTRQRVLTTLIVTAFLSFTILVKSTERFEVSVIDKQTTKPQTQKSKPVMKIKKPAHKTEVKTIRLRVGSSILDEHRLQCGPYACNAQRGGDPGRADLSVFNRESIMHYQTPPQRRPGELWVFQSMEPQWLQKDYRSPWDEMFNYSATYLQGASHNLASKFVKKSNLTTTNFAKVRNVRKASALWSVSECTFANRPATGSARAMYAMELAEYLHIEVFTTRDACVKQLRTLMRRRKHGLKPSLKNHPFYLSFENSLCKDYVTQKFWKVLEEDTYTIPVVLGGLSIEEYTRVAPPNSFIHVKNFTSPKALADHLKYVAENDDAFNYYLQWRNEYEIQKDEIFSDLECYYCKLAHEKPAERWNTFSKDFGSHNCLDISYPPDYCAYYNLSCYTAV